MTDLADEIAARAETLAGRALEQMYLDPFWEERFGERGRRFARDDNLHHVAYLVEAIRAESPDLLANYARWLQRILTTRGMCSRHLAENFSHLAEAIRQTGVADGQSASAYLRAAADALAYTEGPAHAMQLAATEVAVRASETIHARHPELLARPGETSRASSLRDLEHQLSFLADGLALGRSDVYTDYIRWSAGFLSRRSIPVDYLVETLGALDEAMEIVPVEARGAARELLAAGRTALADLPG
jgi:hypothetical protein